jgi:hypothetical protein
VGYFMATHHLAAALTLESSSALLFSLSICVCVYIFTHWADDRGWAPLTPPTTFFRQGDPAHRRVRATERSRSRFFFCVCCIFIFLSLIFLSSFFLSPFSFFVLLFFYFSSKLRREAQSFINRKVGRIALDDHLLLDSLVFLSVFLLFI